MDRSPVPAGNNTCRKDAIPDYTGNAFAGVNGGCTVQADVHKDGSYRCRGDGDVVGEEDLEAFDNRSEEEMEQPIGIDEDYEEPAEDREECNFDE